MHPRERYARYGPTRFGDAELLALVFGAGTPPTADLARGLLDRFGNLSRLAAADVAELTQIEGVGPARAVQLLAALQAGRRSLMPDIQQPLIRSAEDAYAQLYAEMSGQPSEMLFAIYLNRRRAALGVHRLTLGNESHTIVDPRQVYRRAVRVGAAGVIVAHNHPSGDAEPSAQDLAITRRLAEAGALLGISLVDHLIIGAGYYVSLAERGLFRMTPMTPTLMRD